MARRNKGGARQHRLRGAAGRERVDQELEDQKKRRERNQNMPFKFWMPQGESEREVVILDDEPSFFRYEHNLKGRDGKFGHIFECIKEDLECPICEATGDNSAYVMYLTVLDLKPYETRSGQEIPFSRKLFPVKSGQQKKFLRRFDKDGTLRGAVFELSRDGDKAPVIGNDIEFVEFMDEDELLEYEREYTKDGKREVEACHEPFDYDELFPEKTREELLEEYEAEFGRSSVSRSVPGSAEANDEEEMQPRRRRRSRDEDDDEDEKPTRRRRSRAQQEEEDEDPPWNEEEGDDEGEEEEKPRRSRRAARKPSRRPKANDDQGEEEGEEETPKPKRKRRPTRRRA